MLSAQNKRGQSRLTSRPMNGGWGGNRRFVHAFGGDGTKIVPPGTYFTNPLMK